MSTNVAIPTLKRANSTMLEFRDDIAEESEGGEESESGGEEEYVPPKKNTTNLQSNALVAIGASLAGLSSVATPSTKTSNSDVDSTSAKKRKHRVTGNPRGGRRVSKNRSICDNYIATIRSQQLHEVDVAQIKGECIQRLKKYSEESLTSFLTEINKLNLTNTDAEHTTAINIMADAHGDEKAKYLDMKNKSGVELQEDIAENEYQITVLQRMNQVLQYYVDEKNSNKNARLCFKRCILDAIASNDGI